MKRLYLLIFLLSFFLSGCTTQVRDTSYISFIKRVLPQVETGRTKEQVETMLEMPTRFNGIILSKNEGENFRYDYYVEDFLVSLHFDYKRNKKEGYFYKYDIQRLKDPL